LYNRLKLLNPSINLESVVTLEQLKSILFSADFIAEVPKVMLLNLVLQFKIN